MIKHTDERLRVTTRPAEKYRNIHGSGIIGMIIAWIMLAPTLNPAQEQLAAFPPNQGMGAIRAYRVPEDPRDQWVKALEADVFRQEYCDMTKDGQWLVSAHEDGSIRLWRVKAVKP